MAKTTTVDSRNMGKHLTWDSTTGKYDVDLTDYVDNDTIKIDPTTNKLVGAASGLDCQAIENLPVKEYKKGTTVLAQQDGECIRLGGLDALWQEIGVGITANKTTGVVGTSATYNVTVKVTNTGEGENAQTDLKIIKPLLGAYTIKDITYSKGNADDMIQNADLDYTIKGLPKGGVATVLFTVETTTQGTYQFTASVDQIQH